MFRSSGTFISTSCLSLRGTKQSHSTFQYLILGVSLWVGLSAISPRTSFVRLWASHFYPSRKSRFQNNFIFLTISIIVFETISLLLPICCSYGTIVFLGFYYFNGINSVATNLLFLRNIYFQLNS